jgi:zinc protease
MRVLHSTLLAAVLAVPAALASAAENVTSFMLDNGLQLVVIEDHRAAAVTHMAWYKVGSADEPPGKSGIAHYLEHLMFKGTDDLAPGEFSETVRANGGSDNAFTSWDYTGYFQNCRSFWKSAASVQTATPVVCLASNAALRCI